MFGNNQQQKNTTLVLIKPVIDILNMAGSKTSSMAGQDLTLLSVTYSVQILEMILRVFKNIQILVIIVKVLDSQKSYSQ